MPTLRGHQNPHSTKIGVEPRPPQTALRWVVLHMAAHWGSGAFCVLSGLERDKFDNKTVTFEEHIKEEHNMWHYLCFIVLVKVKDSTEYTGPESYVAEMIQVSRRDPPAGSPRGVAWQRHV